MNGQLDFYGREVQNRYINLGPIGKVEFPLDAELSPDCRIVVTVEYALGTVAHGAKLDKQGIAKSDFNELWEATAVRHTVQVTDIKVLESHAEAV